MKIGEYAKVAPALTGLDTWVEGMVFDIENNPFKGMVIAIKDAEGRIFWGQEKYFEPVKLATEDVCNSI
jgi:hypothetical protein